MTLDETVAALAPKPAPKTEYIPTGSLALDVAMKGYPVGRVTEITGDAVSGKTTLALMAVREMQQFGPVLYIPWDSTFSPDRAATMGINVDDLLVLHNMPWQLGPMRFIVIDGVTDKSILPRLAQGDRRGPVTVVATSWKYRMNSGSYPWIDLQYRRTGVTSATVITSDSPRDRQETLYFGNHDLDYGRELLELGRKAGLVSQRGSYYGIAREHSEENAVVSGRAKAVAHVLGSPWLRTEIQNILGQHP